MTRYAKIFFFSSRRVIYKPVFFSFHIAISSHLGNTPLRYSNSRTLELIKRNEKYAIIFIGYDFSRPENHSEFDSARWIMFPLLRFSLFSALLSNSLKRIVFTSRILQYNAMFHLLSTLVRYQNLLTFNHSAHPSTSKISILM